MTTPSGVSKLKEEEWKERLSPLQFEVLREKGTENPGTGEYDKHFEEGMYLCAGCESPLYRSESKFDSGSGWPAFYEAIPEAVAFSNENIREITCKNCDGHLGHDFEGEGYKTPTDHRHCINSVSLQFEPAKK